MAWLIAMCILTDPAADISHFALVSFGICGEKLVQLSFKSCFTAHSRHQAFHVLRHKKRILPGICFGVIIDYFRGDERSEPTAIYPCLHKTVLIVKTVFPVL